VGVIGLKSKIFFTLVVLLATGMLLVDLVSITFWKRDSIQRELRRVSDLLAVIAIEEDWGRVVSRLHHAKCGMRIMRDSQVSPVPGLPLCSSGVIRESLYKAQATGREYSGVLGVWPIPFFPDRRSLFVAFPVRKEGRLVGGIAVAIPVSTIFSSIGGYQRIILVSLLVNLIVLSVVGLFRFIRSTIRPVENLVGLAESYSEEDGIPFLVFGSQDEFGQLSEALHRMLERIEGDRERLRSAVRSLEKANRELRNTQEEMVRAEKLASIGRLAAGMAHEIGNPLGIVQGYMELLKIQSLPREERFDYVERAEQELQRVNSLIRQLLDYSRAPTLERVDVSLHDILTSLVRMVGPQPFMENVDLHCSCAASNDIVTANPDQLRQVFLNCLMNSADAISGAGRKEGRILIRTWNDPAPDTQTGVESVMVSLTDNGEGIREGDLANVLDPFFTTKEPGKGTGLGLSVSYSIITGLGGSMALRSRPGEGTTVEIRLPLAESAGALSREVQNGDFSASSP